MRAFAGSKFNHGERLYGKENAIKKAAMALPSSKAIALLVDSTDAGTPGREYPALTGLQLQTRRAGNETLIDAVGIYRKQDLALWWPVNMAELARIQQIALDGATLNKQLKKPLRPGRLVAIATMGVHETVLPQMAGTTLDRSIDLAPDLPHRLAYLAAQPRPETEAEWEQALGDIGTREDDVVMVPSIGIERLQEALELQRDLGETPAAVTKVVKVIGKLAADSQEAAKALGGDPEPETSKWWADALQADVKRALTAVRARVKAEDSTG
ncbi:MAG: hypothetical protein WKF40_04545 [Thermoleophilaceae bacterium]